MSKVKSQKSKVKSQKSENPANLTRAKAYIDAHPGAFSIRDRQVHSIFKKLTDKEFKEAKTYAESKVPSITSLTPSNDLQHLKQMASECIRLNDDQLDDINSWAKEHKVTVTAMNSDGALNTSQIKCSDGSNYYIFLDEEEMKETSIDMIQSEISSMGYDEYFEDAYLNNVSPYGKEMQRQAMYEDIYIDAKELKSEPANDGVSENKLEQKMKEANVSDMDEYVEHIANTRFQGDGMNWLVNMFGEKEAIESLIEEGYIDMRGVAKELMGMDTVGNVLGIEPGNYFELDSSVYLVKVKE